MTRSSERILALLTALALAGCAGGGSDLHVAQSRAIDQDIEATHVVGPTTTSPAFTERDPSPTVAPWRDEEIMDHIKVLRGETRPPG